MIDGTKTFRRRSENSEGSATVSESAAVAATLTHDAPPESRQTAAPMNRREAIAALGPQLGKALVRFLRAANSLKHEMEEKQNET